MWYELEIKKMQKELDYLRKQIELVKEEKNNSLTQKNNYDYEDYKNDVNGDDLKKLMDFKKIKPIRFIPLIGFF